MSYKTKISEDRRLVILRLLEKSSGYIANLYLLQNALEGFGHVDSMDVIKTEVAWLEEQGLVTISEPGGVVLAKITQRGLEVANGRANVPGVKKPSPED